MESVPVALSFQTFLSFGDAVVLLSGVACFSVSVIEDISWNRALTEVYL